MNIFSNPTRLLIGTGIILLVGILLAVLFFFGSPVQSQSMLFVATDQTHFQAITWQKKSDGTLTGQWTLYVSHPDQTTPVVVSLPPLSGQISEQTITLSAGTSASLQGTITGNTLEGLTTADGQQTSLTWYAANSDQVDQLESAFTKYELVANQLTILQHLLVNPPADSDPTTFAIQVQNAQTTVASLQQRAGALQQIGGNVCGTGELALFEEQYPPAASTFQVSVYPTAKQAFAHATLAQHYQQVQSSWASAAKTPVPTIAGLTLPWRLSLPTYQEQTKQAEMQLAMLQKDLQTDYQNMATFQQQAQAAGTTVQQLRQAGGC